tara:strand:+ start:2720 stop:3451 length:732 start_codon:yes stop_codon:yes gene_type:complete
MKNNIDLKEFLDNKSVVIIGPASCVLKNKNGSFIDSFDVVVRVNRGVEPTDTYPEYIGQRCDLLYNCLYEHPDNGGIIDLKYFSKKGVKSIIYHPKVSFQGVATNSPPDGMAKGALNKIQNSKYSSHMIDYQFYNSISKQTKCRPNTGYIAIHHLLSYNIKTLFITGYTFYMDKFMSGYKDHVDKDEFNDKCFHSKRHNQKNLFNHLKECRQKDSRIQCDKYLSRILELENLDKSKSSDIFKD